MSSPETCSICGDPHTEEVPLIRAPCERHHVCVDDLEQYFRQAIKNESQYPPSCCDAPFMLTEYEKHLPFEVSWEFQIKEQGEYSVQKKFRVYCANPSCATFLRPDSHITDSEHQVTYAICESEDCGKVSCIACKTVLANGVADHLCESNETEKQFKATAKKEGYQECYTCGSTIELAEACNHITCQCGNQFCYICGKDWPGAHGCPRYGPAIYDEEGYNQEGYHRDTDLNREGYTRLQQRSRDLNEDDEDGEGDEEEEDEDQEEDRLIPPWATEEFREFLRELPRDLWEDAIDQEETQRIDRGEFHIPAPPPVNGGEDAGDENEDVGQNGEDMGENDGVVNENSEDVGEHDEDRVSVVEGPGDEIMTDANIEDGPQEQQADIIDPIATPEVEDLASSHFTGVPSPTEAYAIHDLTAPTSPAPDAAITHHRSDSSQHSTAYAGSDLSPTGTPDAVSSGSDSSNLLPVPKLTERAVPVEHLRDDDTETDASNTKPLNVGPKSDGPIVHANEVEVDMHILSHSLPGA